MSLRRGLETTAHQELVRRLILHEVGLAIISKLSYLHPIVEFTNTPKIALGQRIIL